MPVRKVIVYLEYLACITSQAGLIAQAGRRAIKQKAEAALIPDPFVTLICSVKTNHYITQAGDLKSTLVFSHTTLWVRVYAVLTKYDF